MKVLLCALNAKYVHSNLAVHYLKEYANSYLRDKGDDLDKVNTIDEVSVLDEVDILIEELSINQPFDDIMAVIYQHKPDKLFFSCYIWNISIVKELVVELKKVLPKCEIWLGGPEVSYDKEEMLGRYPQLEGIVAGPGEEDFLQIISGKKTEGSITLDSIPFPYKDMEVLKNKIIYYESSRGCPFSCSYCLSSKERNLEFRSIELVKKELKYFVDNNIKQVKLVDRTFNCNGKRAREIWEFLYEHDKGITNFHFEIAADLLSDEDLAILKKLRPGLVQFEIGVQSTNKETLKEIERNMDFAKVTTAVKQIKAFDNIHLHLDLIAGLPLEDYHSFIKSFNHVYNLKPNKIQLGFLKVLKGSAMEEKATKYNLIYQSRPPYQVLSTTWLTYQDILKLNMVEEMLEVYYNSGQFANALDYLVGYFETPFRLYEELGEYYADKGCLNLSHSRQSRYELLIGFVIEKSHVAEENHVTKKRHVAKTCQGDEKLNLRKDKIVIHDNSVIDVDINIDKFRQLLTLDYYLRENVKKRPKFAGEETVTKKEADDFYTKEAAKPSYLRGHNSADKRQLRKTSHLEWIGDSLYLFDYHNMNQWKKQAKVIKIGGLFEKKNR